MSIADSTGDRRDPRLQGVPTPLPPTTCRRLEGHVAIVTGGASGIGKATARRLYDEGASVVVADINLDGAAALAGELGESALAIWYDAADSDSVASMIDQAATHFGQLDILHNNAALLSSAHFSQDRTAIDTDFEIWDTTFAINARGYFACCKYALPHLIARGGGSIINTASVSGVRGDLASIAYGSSKAAIIGLTRYVATQHAAQGVRCNAINPGPILSEAGLENIQGEIAQAIGASTLVNRWGQPDEVAAVVAWLASGDARYVTGTTIDVEGGMLSHQPYYSDLVRMAQR